MGRPRKDHPPSAVPERDDLIWAAAVFEERGRDQVMGGQMHVQVLSRNAWTLQRLARLFGGTVYQTGSAQRWEIVFERAETFLMTIRPFVSSQYAPSVDSILAATKALSSRQGAKEALQEKMDTLSLPWPLDEDILLAVGPEASAYRAHDVQQAEAWAELARTRGLFFRRDGNVLYMSTEQLEETS